ncbi:hypothetical protein GCM10022267_28870 [Lentzea roselyniae]|uniref:Uncharacterized protein n=1 Tax=Lentzea roselyniae TaxID=531940 RepID=A0ABP7AU48_9PSEU
MSNLVNRLPVEVVRWPVDAAAREARQRSGTLCLLVLEKNVPAPVLTDMREDWVRVPVRPAMPCRSWTCPASSASVRVPSCCHRPNVRWSPNCCGVSAR